MGWRMGVNGSVWEPRDMTKGVLSTSDNAGYVNHYSYTAFCVCHALMTRAIARLSQDAEAMTGGKRPTAVCSDVSFPGMRLRSLLSSGLRGP